MRKTFFASPVIGGLAAVLGWLGAVLFRNSMPLAEFNSIRFGWTGLMIGAVAAATVLLLLLASELVEPVIVTACAAIGTFLLWQYQSLPFSTAQFNGTTTGYWIVFAIVAVASLLVLIGAKAVRESSAR